MLEQILPVLDLKGGVVVHGIAGQRESYQAITSDLTRSTHPCEVARVLTRSLGTDEVYVADLDALSGQEPDWNTLDELSNNHRIWLDAGVSDLESIRKLRKNCPNVARIIIALESLTTFADMAALVSEVGPENTVFSLDLFDGIPVISDAAVRGFETMEFVDAAVAQGIRSLIVLDVATVGRKQGPVSSTLCRNVRTRFPTLELVSGGGIRHLNDVEQLVHAGCDRVLVATALHTGQIMGTVDT